MNETFFLQTQIYEFYIWTCIETSLSLICGGVSQCIPCMCRDAPPHVKLPQIIMQYFEMISFIKEIHDIRIAWKRTLTLIDNLTWKDWHICSHYHWSIRKFLAVFYKSKSSQNHIHGSCSNTELNKLMQTLMNIFSCIW